MKRRNPHRSQGAPYVRTLRHSILMWDEDGEAKLLWSSRWAVFVAANGEHRKIYGLTLEDAQAMCRVHGVAFYNQDGAPLV